jgi:methanogenic corrinoid protein MtbC1
MLELLRGGQGPEQNNSRLPEEVEARIITPPPANSRITKNMDPCNGHEAQLAKLVRTIESEIIPCLMLAHRVDPDAQSVQPDPQPGVEQVHEFAAVMRVQDAAAGVRYVEVLREEGYRLETLYLSLISPAAKYLGDLWSADLCDFLEVTIALGRMQQVLRELSPAFVNQSEIVPKGLKIILSPAPGEQHTLGLLMVKEFFLRQGWSVAAGAVHSSQDVLKALRAEWFDVVGVSAGCEVNAVQKLAAFIGSLRIESRNRAVVVMVGGPLFACHPEYADAVGADAMATDAREGLLLAERLVAQRA